MNREFFKPKEPSNLLNIYVLEGKVAVCFHLHGELNILMDTVEVVKEVPMPVRTLRPDDESVICLMEPL